MRRHSLKQITLSADHVPSATKDAKGANFYAFGIGGLDHHSGTLETETVKKDGQSSDQRGRVGKLVAGAEGPW
jgi:hypothetical protein